MKHWLIVPTSSMEAQLLKTKCVLLLWHRIAFCFSFTAMANSRRHTIQLRKLCFVQKKNLEFWEYAFYRILRDIVFHKLRNPPRQPCCCDWCAAKPQPVGKKIVLALLQITYSATYSESMHFLVAFISTISKVTSLKYKGHRELKLIASAIIPME